MSCGLLGTLLLLLPGGASAVGRWSQENPGQLWVSPGKTAELSCCVPDISRSVNWYKEKPDGSLYWIYWSSGFPRPVGKYTGGKKEGRKAEQCFSLNISSAQREDSGVYYCSSRKFYHLFGKGTRLVVTDATEPQLSILVPIDAQEPGQPPAQIPLLCHLHDLPPGWDTVHWQPGGGEAPVVAAAMDEHGVLSAWSITWVSAEEWDGAAVCTALQSGTNRTLSVAISKDGCLSWTLLLGLPFVSLLFLLQLTILLCRRRLARGGATTARCGNSPAPLHQNRRLQTS